MSKSQDPRMQANSSSKVTSPPHGGRNSYQPNSRSGDLRSDLYSLLNLGHDSKGKPARESNAHARTETQPQLGHTVDWSRMRSFPGDHEFSAYASDGDHPSRNHPGTSTADISRRSGGSKGKKMFGNDNKTTMNRRQSSVRSGELDVGLNLAVGTSGEPALRNSNLNIGSSWSHAGGSVPYSRSIQSPSVVASYTKGGDNESVASAPLRIAGGHKGSVLQQVKAKLKPTSSDSVAENTVHGTNSLSSGDGDSKHTASDGYSHNGFQNHRHTFQIQQPPTDIQSKYNGSKFSQDEVELLENVEFMPPSHLSLEQKRLLPVSSASNLKDSISQQLSPSSSSQQTDANKGLNDKALKDLKRKQMKAHVERMLHKWRLQEPIGRKEPNTGPNSKEFPDETEVKLRRMYERTRGNEKRAKDLYKRIDSLRRVTQTDINAIAHRIEQLENDLYSHNVQLAQKEQDAKIQARTLRHRLEAEVDEKIATLLKAKEEGYHQLVRHVENRVANIESHFRNNPWFDGLFHRSVSLALTGAGAIVSIVAGLVTGATNLVMMPVNVLRGTKHGAEHAPITGAHRRASTKGNSLQQIDVMDPTVSDPVGKYGKSIARKRTRPAPLNLEASNSVG